MSSGEALSGPEPGAGGTGVVRPGLGTMSLMMHTYRDEGSLFVPYEWTWREKISQALTAWLLLRVVRRVRRSA